MVPYKTEMFDRETMMMIAIVITLVGTVYMFREFQKQKQEITNVKYYVSRKLSHTPTSEHTAKVSDPEQEPEGSAESDEN